jgi:hypothetical protein
LPAKGIGQDNLCNSIGIGSSGSMERNLELETMFAVKFSAVVDAFDERGRRLWAAGESDGIGYSGDALVSDAMGLSRDTIRAGRRQIHSGNAVDHRLHGRRGCPRIERSQPGPKEELIDPLTRGESTSPCRVE